MIDFAAVEILYDLKAASKPIVIKNNEEAAYLGSNDDWIKRAYNSRIATLTLPDKTKIFTFKEKKEKDNGFSFNTVTIILRLNGTIMKIYQNGEV